MKISLPSKIYLEKFLVAIFVLIKKIISILWSLGNETKEHKNTWAIQARNT